MAADSSFNQVQVLVQGGSAANVAPPPTAGSAVTVVNHGATLGADHLAFTTTAWLALDRDTPDTVANCIEIILEHSWSPGGQIFELLGRGDLHSGPGRIAIYADPNVENGYIYQHSPNYVAGPGDLVGGQQKFVLPAPPMRVLLRIQTRTVNFVTKRTIDIIPETGAPVYIDGGQPAFYDWDNQLLYPMTVGATTGARVATPDTEAFARVTRLANPNRVGQEDAISRIAVDWVMYPFQRGYTTASTGSVLKDITLTIGAFGGAVSASVTRHNTTGEPVVAELVGKFTAALIAAGYSASYSSDGWMYSVSVAPPLNGGDWDFNFSIDGSWVYEDLALDRGTPWVYSIGSSVTQRGYSSSGPNSFQRERITVFVADPNKQYEVTASLSDPAWLPATTATELIGGGESVEAGLARLSSRLGLNGSWSQPSVGMFVIDHGFSDYLLHAFSASLTEVRSLPSAITKLYALRITYVARTENTFPTLPWPTTSIGGIDSGGGSEGVPLNVRYYYPFLTSEAAATSIPNRGSIASHALGVVPGDVVSPSGQAYYDGGSAGPSGPSLDFAAMGDAFTMEGWVLPSLDGYGLFGVGEAFFTTDGAHQLRLWAPETGQYTVMSTGYSADTWVHVAYVRDAQGLAWRTYLNGVLATSGAFATPTAYGSTHSGLTIGAYAIGAGYTATGCPLDDLIVTAAVKYTGNFTPAARGTAFAAPPSSTDVLGAQYVTLADFTSVGTGAQQAFAPDAYGTSSVTLAGFTVAHSVTVNGNSINGTGTSDALAGLTCSGAGVAATPTNLTGACTLDDLVSTASGVASTPIEVTIATTLEGASQSAYGLTLVPAEATGAAVLDAHFVSAFTAEMTTPPTAQVAVVMPAPVVSSTGSVKDDRITAQMPAATALSWGHAVMTTRLPSAAAAAAGTVANIGALLAAMPMPTVVSDGRVAGSSAMFVACPSPQSAAFGAGEVHASLSGFAAAASVTTGATAQISAAMPMAVVVASLTRVNTGQIIALMPMLIPSAGAAARLTMPMARVFISGNALAATGFEAYVLNLGVSPDVNLRRKNDMSNAQLTRYTNYPFTQIVRFRDAYYGVAADGLYRLGGLTDAGAPITWAVDLCTTDFDTPLKKTLVSVYLGGSAGPNVDFTVRGGETADMMHAYTTSATAVLRNHRQRFGLGRKTRYYSLGLSGQGALDLDSLDFEVANTTRRI